MRKLPVGIKTISGSRYLGLTLGFSAANSEKLMLSSKRGKIGFMVEFHS
jgi:hypothetical protein